MTKHAVGAPLLGKLHYGARQVAVKLLELRFEAREQRERIRGGSGKSGQDPVAIKTAQLARRRLQNFLAERHLPVSSHDDFPIAADAQDGGGTYLYFLSHLPLSLSVVLARRRYVLAPHLRKLSERQRLS